MLRHSWVAGLAVNRFLLQAQLMSIHEPPRLHRFLRELMPSLIVSELAQQQDSLPAGHWPKLNQGARKTSPQKPDICCSPIPRFCSFTP